MAHIIAFMDETLHTGIRTPAPGGNPARVCRSHRPMPRGNAVPSKAPIASADAASNAEEVRMDRVNELRAAIADGSYRVTAADLADKILHTMIKK